MAITIWDIADKSRKSGFRYVSVGGGGRGFQGNLNGGGRPDGWRGPLRKHAAVAAQDYCDHVNAHPAAPAGLKSAGHLVPERRKLDDGLSYVERKLLSTLQRRQREGLLASSGAEGHVYLVGEQPSFGRPYFHAGGTSFSVEAVKVGYSFESPQFRVRQLQTGNPRVLVLLGYVRGTQAREREIHDKFLAHNIVGEWFLPTIALLSEFGLEIETGGSR